MNTRKFRQTFRIPEVVALTFALIGCGGEGMSGKYEGQRMAVEFKSGGKAIFSNMGIASEVSYRVDGDKIVLENKAGNLVLTRNKDGSLDGGLDTLKKVN